MSLTTFIIYQLTCLVLIIGALYLWAWEIRRQIEKVCDEIVEKHNLGPEAKAVLIKIANGKPWHD